MLFTFYFSSEQKCPKGCPVKWNKGIEIGFTAEGFGTCNENNVYNKGNDKAPYIE